MDRNSVHVLVLLQHSEKDKVAYFGHWEGEAHENRFRRDGEQAHNLPLGDRQADAVQQIGEALGGHLALCVQSEAEPPQAGPVAAHDPYWEA
jgi:hypothetical protein